MTERPVTLDLAKGLQRVRWGDTPQEVLVQYPHAVATASLHGKNPETKEPFYVAPSLVITHFVELPAVALVANVSFHEAALVGVDLYPTSTFQDRTLPPQIRHALERFGTQLGVEIVIDRPGPWLQEWDVGPARVELYMQRNDFSLSVYAPETEALNRATPTHRGYRRMQWQRASLKSTLSPAQWGGDKKKGKAAKPGGGKPGGSKKGS